jgi:hypothetical protein
LNRKLWLLNFALIAAIAGAGWRLREEARAFHARERAGLHGKVAVPAAPAPPPATPSQVAVPASYLDIAQKMLFSKDRNSQVILDPPKPPEAPKPLPALPAVSGMMDIGDGPTVVMSEKRGGHTRGVRPGETIGEFKLVSVKGDELTFAWQDRTVTKKLEDLIDRGVADAGAAPAGSSTASTPSVAPPPPAGKPEPGVQLSDGVSSCQTNDSTPAGTVVNGMRKETFRTPFGEACRWVVVK